MGSDTRRATPPSLQSEHMGLVPRRSQFPKRGPRLGWWSRDRTGDVQCALCRISPGVQRALPSRGLISRVDGGDNVGLRPSLVIDGNKINAKFEMPTRALDKTGAWVPRRGIGTNIRSQLPLSLF